MSEVTPEKKEVVMKSLAVIGFLAAIVLLAFLAVKAVSVLPSAFSSLASIADSVYNYDRNPSLTVSTENSVVKSGEAFTISWNEIKRDGSYSVSFACVEGITIETRNAAGEIVTIPCGTGYAISKDTTSLEIVVTTAAQRFTDIDYTVALTPSDPRREAITTASRITIVNASLPTTGGVIVTEPEPAPAPETPATPAPTPTTPATPTTPVAPTTPTYTYVEKVTYSLPVSDPKGNVDLRVTYVGVSEKAGGPFAAANTLEVGEGGSLRFIVKNIGTKTAEDWSFKAELPADIDYSSGDQKALKPNEEAVITLSFTGIERATTESVAVSVTAKGDVNTKNNNFTAAVKIVK